MVSYRAEHQPLNHPATPFSTSWKVLQRYDFFRNCAREIVELRCPYLLGLKVTAVHMAVPDLWNYGIMELQRCAKTTSHASSTRCLVVCEAVAEHKPNFDVVSRASPLYITYPPYRGY